MQFISCGGLKMRNTKQKILNKSYVDNIIIDYVYFLLKTTGYNL